MSILGVWMWPESISLYGADRAVSLCATAGVTDIFFLTKGLSGAASCRSAIAPQCSGQDLLGELLNAAHARGVRVHAWLTSASDEHYKALHPQSGRCHYTRGRDKGLISLSDEGYLAYMQQFVRELCRNYAIDGLHLDYIRYNHLLYGWSQEDMARYAAAGADIAHLRSLMDKTFLSGQDTDCIFDALRAGDAHALALAKVRRSDVRHFAQTLSACARAERTDLILSAALMPEGAYQDTAFSDLHYGQNYPDAAALYDFVLPMAYSNAYDQHAPWVRAVAEGTLGKGLRTVMGLHAYDGGTGPSLDADIRCLDGLAIDGVCLFRFGAFVLAFREDAGLRVVNTLSKPVTALQTADGLPLLPPETSIAPGDEQTLPLPPQGSILRAFCADDEVCIYCSDC